MLRFLEKNKVILVYVPLIIYWLVLLAATSYPTDNLPSLGVSDKTKHFGAYFVLAVILNIALLVQDKYRAIKQKASLFTIIIGAFYGVLDELHQALIPGRSCELLDWTADLGGLLLGVTLVYLISKKENFSAVPEKNNY